MINEIRLKILEFLGTTIVGTNYFYFDYWTFIHLFSGFLGMWIIFKFIKRIEDTQKFVLLFLFVFFWEIFELSVSWIKIEIPIDIIYDLIIGMFGGWLFYFLRNKFKVSSQLH